MHAGSWESTREAFEWHEAKPSASLASRVLFRCFWFVKHGPFLLGHCHFKLKLIKHRILLNHAERFDWLNAVTRFHIRTGVRLSRFRCTLAPYKKRAKNFQICFNIEYKLYFIKALLHCATFSATCFAMPLRDNCWRIAQCNMGCLATFLMREALHEVELSTTFRNGLQQLTTP